MQFLQGSHEQTFLVLHALDRGLAAGHGRVVGHARCQGGLDPRANGALTGWVRMASDPKRKLNVRLESGGRVIARATASAARPDLERARLAGSECGFVLPLNGFDASAGAPCEVVVEETGWRFDEPPFVLAPDGRGGHRLDFSGIAPIQARPSRSFTEPAGEAPRMLRPQETVAARSVQKELLAEIERLTALMEQARSAAARLIVAIGDDANLAQRVFGALSSKPRGGGQRHRPPENEEQPPARLN